MVKRKEHICMSCTEKLAFSVKTVLLQAGAKECIATNQLKHIFSRVVFWQSGPTICRS